MNARTSLLAALTALAATADASAQVYYLRVRGDPPAPASSAAPCTIETVASTAAQGAGGSFSVEFRVSQPNGAPLKLAAQGTLPPGVTFDAAKVALVGKPTQAGTFGPVRVAAVERAGVPGEFCKSEAVFLAVATVPDAPEACTAPWGGTVAHGASVTAFTSAAVPFGGSCSTVSQVRTCTDGVLSGDAANAACSPAAPSSCATPWGQTVAHGASVAAYSSSSVPFGASCSAVAQTRTCSNGALSGSAAYGACSPLAPTYRWSTGSFGSCSATCGGGTQTRAVSCVRSDGQTVADMLCTDPKPAVSQTCNTQTCQKSCDTLRFRTTTSNGNEIDMLRGVWSESSCKSLCESHPDIAGCVWNSTGLCFRYSGNPYLVAQHSGSWSSQTLYGAICR